MASGPNPNSQSLRSKRLVLLLPAIGAAVAIVAVVLIVQFTSGFNLGGSGRPMSDGSDGSADDPGLKPLGGGGLKYRDLKEGSGKEVPKGATVTIHYTGWLADGTVFDSSKDSPGGQPATFPLGNLIQGWQQGIPGMKVGGIRKLVIPGALGYGPQGSPPKIPGNATLIFEIELLDFRPGMPGFPGGMMPGNPELPPGHP